MNDMDRRRFLAGLSASAALAGTGCGAARIGASAPLPSLADLASLDMTGLLQSMDSTLATIRTASSFPTLLTPGVQESIRQDPRMDNIDGLTRDAFRSLFLVSAFRGMEEAAQAHPGVQSRMLAGLSDMDSSVLGVHRAFQSLTPTERADAARAFREDKALRERVLSAIDVEAVRSGASPAHREHLKKVTEHASFRLRQSPSLFFDELDKKMEKVAARELSPLESERFYEALMGSAAFEEKRSRMIALANAWQSVPGVARPAQPISPAATAPLPQGAPPPMPPSAPPSPTVWLPVQPGSVLVPPAGIHPVYVPMNAPVGLLPGTWTLRAGGILLGMGLLHVGVGIALLFTGVSLWGYVEMTHGALQLVGGIITLIVGAVQRGSRPAEDIPSGP